MCAKNNEKPAKKKKSMLIIGILFFLSCLTAIAGIIVFFEALGSATSGKAAIIPFIGYWGEELLFWGIGMCVAGSILSFILGVWFIILIVQSRNKSKNSSMKT